MKSQLALLTLFSVLFISCTEYEKNDELQAYISAAFAEIDDEHYIDTTYSPMQFGEEGDSFIYLMQTYHTSGVLDGMSMSFYESGMINGEESYVMGEKYGIRKKYYRNGVVQQEALMRRGVLDSLAFGYFDSGELQYKMTLWNDRAGGNAREYYDNGMVKLYSFVLPNGTQVYRTEYNQQGQITKEQGKLTQVFLQEGECDSLAVGELCKLTAIVTDLPHLPLANAEKLYVVYRYQNDDWVQVATYKPDFVFGWDRIPLRYNQPGHYRFVSQVDFRKNKEVMNDSLLVSSFETTVLEE